MSVSSGDALAAGHDTSYQSANTNSVHTLRLWSPRPPMGFEEAQSVAEIDEFPGGRRGEDWPAHSYISLRSQTQIGVGKPSFGRSAAPRRRHQGQGPA